MTAADIAAPSRVGADKSSFYLWTGVAIAVIALAGFAPTFWIPLAQGVPERLPLVAIHGAFCYAWIAFLIWQAWLARSGQMVRHRDMGLVGASLATALVLSGIMVTVLGSRRVIAQAGYVEQQEAFMIVVLSELAGFTGFLIAALVNLRRPEWHKRFMIAATAAVLPSPVARLIVVYIVLGGHMPSLHGNVGFAGFPPGPPPSVPGGTVPDLITTEFFIVAGIIHDWRKRGGVHPAWWWAGGVFLAYGVLKAPLSGTALWHGVARWLLAL
jgi:hypothetical protein